MTQKELVMDWFRTHKYLHRNNAMNDFYRIYKTSIWNLPDVIMRLREDGVPIETMKMRKGKKYVKYFLGEEYGRAANVCENNNRE